MTIKATVHIINSRRDQYGNTYWAATYTDTETGKSYSFTVNGGESNLTYSLRASTGLNLPHGSYVVTSSELPIREFNRTTKGWPCAGCREEEIATNIRKAIA